MFAVPDGVTAALWKTLWGDRCHANDADSARDCDGALILAQSPMTRPRPAVVSVEMGYGHLRAALPLAEALGTELVHADRPPFSDEDEQALWARVRRAQELLSKPSQFLSWFGAAGWMDKV